MTFLPTITGFITQEKYLLGRSLSEIERIMGFHAGRLAQGAVIVVLEQIPQSHQFELRGYTQVAGHHFQAQYGKVALDEEKTKKYLSTVVFTNSGLNRLVKVLANTPHNKLMEDEDQYPPGLGVPQWKVTQPLRARVVAVLINTLDRYLPNT